MIEQKQGRHHKQTNSPPMKGEEVLGETHSFISDLKSFHV